MYRKAESSCLHVRGGFLIHIRVRIGLPPPFMSIFSLAKGEKEHKVFKMRMNGGEFLNSCASNEKAVAK